MEIYLVCYVWETGIIAFIYLDELIDLRTNLKYLQMVVCPTAEEVKSFFSFIFTHKISTIHLAFLSMYWPSIVFLECFIFFNFPGEPSHLRAVFHRMGLSDKEIVILSGAHTLVSFQNKEFPPPFLGFAAQILVYFVMALWSPSKNFTSWWRKLVWVLIGIYGTGKGSQGAIRIRGILDQQSSHFRQ